MDSSRVYNLDNFESAWINLLIRCSSASSISRWVSLLHIPKVDMGSRVGALGENQNALFVRRCCAMLCSKIRLWLLARGLVNAKDAGI